MKLVLLCASAVLVAMTACSDSTKPADPATIASVSLTPTQVVVVKGEKASLTLSARDSAGNEVAGVAAEWTSSAPEVAAVSAEGVVTGIAYGSATITAAIGTHSSPAGVVITAAPTVKSYSVLDLGEGHAGSAYGRHLSDSGDVLIGGDTLVRDGVATPLLGCPYPITISGPGHVLCSIGKGDSISSYAIWRDGTLTPVAAADTFVAQHFRAYAMNDSDEVAGLFYMPAFTNANCPANGARCLSVWKNGTPSFPGYDAGGSDVMLMNNKQQAVVEYAIWNENVYRSVIYDVPAGTSIETEYGIEAFNDNGWGAIGRPWIAHGSPDPFRSTASVITPTALIVLGSGKASGINDSNVVTGTLDVGAFIWRGSGVSLLTNASIDPSWTITGAIEINNRGQILAVADNSDGRKAHAVLLTPTQP